MPPCMLSHADPRARPEARICCALSLGKGATLTVETRHNSCTLPTTLSKQGGIQKRPGRNT